MWTLLIALAALGADRPQGTKIEAAQAPVDVVYAAPHIADLDGDGLKDLLVGEPDGRLRVYKNRGQNDQPRFDDFTYFQAAGQVATVPHG